MIFEKITLTEAPDDKLTPVSRKESDITYDNLPADVKTLADAGKWAEAYSKLVNAADIDVFLDKFLDEYSGFSSFKNQVNKIRPALKRELMSLGSRAFDTETNPILAFLNTYFAAGNEFTEEQFKFLLNLWTGGIITDKDLKKHGPSEHIIFNKHLYDMTNGTFIVQAYCWLSKRSNVESYIDLKHSDDKRYKNIVTLILHKGAERDPSGKFMSNEVKFKNSNEFRDFIIFVNTNDPSGEIHDASEIQRRLTVLQDINSLKTDTKKETDTRTIRPEKYTREEIDAILKSGIDKLTPADINKLLNYFKDKRII